MSGELPDGVLSYATHVRLTSRADVAVEDGIAA
jgi:hypothetical protein